MRRHDGRADRGSLLGADGHDRTGQGRIPISHFDLLDGQAEPLRRDDRGGGGGRAHAISAAATSTFALIASPSEDSDSRAPAPGMRR